MGMLLCSFAGVTAAHLHVARCRGAAGELRLFPAGMASVVLQPQQLARMCKSWVSRPAIETSGGVTQKEGGFGEVCSGVFRRKKKKVKFNLEKRGRKKAGRKQAEFSACILSTHPCVSFPSGRNKNCLCFSRPFRKSYRAIIALLSNGQSLFRLSLLPLPT